MCGIAGYISLTPEPPDSDLVGRMQDRLRHRGPDEAGFFAADRVAFAHRRLTILDPDGGGQPMDSISGRSVLIHNGEIYNSPALREEMRTKQQRRFRGHSDTEVVLEGLEAHGPEFVSRLNGIFAFAWHEPRTGRTLLARDPFGVKPLYYHQTTERILFASEIRALLADPTLHAELDPDELAVLLTLRYSPSPGTLFKGIYKLPPGHMLRIREDTVREERFDHFVPDESSGGGFDDWTAQYATALASAVKGQLLSDVPVGLFLSGGADSKSGEQFVISVQKLRAP